jgi:pimeloyl-ACP methyl ester carboxylesterase
LGAERINLYGTSYGTRVAQHYLRRFPLRVRAVILDGVVPAPLALGPATATHAEQALLSILARCAGEPACSKRYGDPARTYHSVRALLRNRAAPVALADPSSGDPARFSFTTAHLATVLRLASYTPEYAALLPLMLDAAAAHQDYAPLAAQFLLVERGYAEALATGMHNSVVCTEDVPFYDLRAIDRERLADTFLGTLQLDGLDTVCRIWPHGPIDADFHAPLASDVPALLLSGSDDPVTPPAFAQLAARGFSRGLSIVLGGFGHGQLTAPCMDRVLAQFLARASVVGLDVSCTRRARPMPFFTSLNGPPP